jgi:hypothetical protein
MSDDRSDPVGAKVRYTKRLSNKILIGFHQPAACGHGFVPLMRKMEGFRAYYLLDGGPDVLITISIFDSADEAFASNDKAAA